VVKSIFIGSNGYLGQHLARELDENGFDNANYDIHPSPSETIKNYQFFDLLDEKSFETLDPEIDFVFLFAGLTGTAEGFEGARRFIEVNEIGMLNLLEWMRRTQCRARVVFPSTRLVYRGREDCVLREDDLTEAKTVYAANKIAAESLLKMYQNAFDIAYTVFRICVPYGNAIDGTFSYGTLGFFMGQAKKGKNISLFGDGQLRRTFTHVSDIASLIVSAVQAPSTRNEVLNIGGQSLTLLNAAEVIAAKAGVDVDFVSWPELAYRLESGSTVFDDSKLQQMFPFDYKHTLESWLEEIW